MIYQMPWCLYYATLYILFKYLNHFNVSFLGAPPELDTVRPYSSLAYTVIPKYFVPLTWTIIFLFIITSM